MVEAAMNFPQIDATVLPFSSQLDAIRQDLYYCDVNFARGRMRDIGRGMRAAAYVYLAAALERVVADLLTATLDEVTATSVELKKVRLSLFSLIQAPHFDSLQQIRGLKMWTRRSQVFISTDAETPCIFDAALLPLDGRTIRPEHIDVIWEVFGFSTPAFPSIVSRLALTELADTRNSIAHGEDIPARIGGQKSVSEMLSLIDRIETVVISIWTAATHYIANKEYLRA